MSARGLSTEELVAELQRRGRIPACRCQRWKTYLGRYDQDGYTWRCRGCLRAVEKCECV
jgi:hypothetical protein